ncbi:methionine/alanine import family NSS transporter small subunit [Gulosibacter chungangensis]|uniref:Methionine/alanine import family NSS transporter small subunit n=1 Tax=Gulosibacter chungangensis TaxID=979746 RepID=A0A7J5BD46_9MICO|nr:methionine/alanine import family NSS transporter small subunit [Gulosibacter chungangensis]KAB1643519.1 methionine/alanine import family NSS transporter small subunit [Gulosibacter chungangensis]
MTPIAITMMAISLVTVWGGLVVVTINLMKRGTDRD